MTAKAAGVAEVFLGAAKRLERSRRHGASARPRLRVSLAGRRDATVAATVWIERAVRPEAALVGTVRTVRTVRTVQTVQTGPAGRRDATVAATVRIVRAVRRGATAAGIAPIEPAVRPEAAAARTGLVQDEPNGNPGGRRRGSPRHARDGRQAPEAAAGHRARTAPGGPVRGTPRRAALAPSAQRRCASSSPSCRQASAPIR